MPQWNDSTVHNSNLGDREKAIRDELNAVAGSVADSSVTFTDITTGNVDTTKHGFAPKAPNDATKFLNGTGAYSVPTSSSVGVSSVQWVDGTNGSDSNSGKTVNAATATIQKAISNLPTTTPGKGGIVYILPGVYTENVTGVEGLKMVGLGGRTVGSNSNFGVVIQATANNQTILTFDGGGTNIMQGGPIIQGAIELDGGGFTGVTGLLLRNTNRAMVYDLVGRRCQYFIYMNGPQDCAWHNFYGVSGRENTINVYALLGYGFRWFGGEFNCSSAQTGFMIGDSSVVTSQFSHVHIFGAKVDGGTGLNVDSGWFSQFHMTMENCANAAIVSHNANFANSGKFMDFHLHMDSNASQNGLTLNANTMNNWIRLIGVGMATGANLIDNSGGRYAGIVNGEPFVSEFGMQVAYVEGAGRVTGADADFPVAPTNGTLEAVKNTTSGLTYLSVKTSSGWHAVQIT